MTRGLILSDVDGVAADLMGAFSAHVMERYGVDVPCAHIAVHSRMGRSPLLRSQNEALARFFPGRSDGDGRGIGGAFECFMRDRDVYSLVRPIDGAQEAFATLREWGYTFCFVTALMKGARDHFRSKMEWIERWFPGIPIITAPSGQKDLVRGDWAVDDRYDICEAWEAAGVRTFLFGQPWNEAPDGAARHDWAGITAHLVRETLR